MSQKILRFYQNRFKYDSQNYNDINNFFEKYNLYAFQHRILNNMLSFSYKILFYDNSPKNLQVQMIRNDSRNLSYNLRNSVNLIEPMSNN